MGDSQKMNAVHLGGKQASPSCRRASRVQELGLFTLANASLIQLLPVMEGPRSRVEIPRVLDPTNK